MVSKRLKVHSFTIKIIITCILIVNIISIVSPAAISKISNPLKVICTTLYVKKPYAVKPTRIQLEQSVAIVKKRLAYKGIKKMTFKIYENTGEIKVELYTSNLTFINNPDALISQIIKPSIITFQDMYQLTKDKGGNYIPKGKIILSNKDIVAACLDVDPESAETVVVFKLSDSGRKSLFTATNRIAKTKGTIGIFFDNQLIMECGVTEPIYESEIQVSGGLTFKEARDFTNLINSGVLPFNLAYKNLIVKW